MKIPDSAQTDRLGVALVTQAFTVLDFAFRAQDVLDAGIDAQAELIEDGQATGRLLALQIKTGESYLARTEGDCYVHYTDSAHVDYWLQHALPVLICLCDLETSQVYWQVINQETSISTGKGFKIKVPVSQRVDNDSITALQDILTPIVPTQSYTLVKTEDVSHAGAKRYSFRVVLNGPNNKAEIAAIVRQVTREGRSRRYHRNRQSQQKWGNSDAQVVWGFIYSSVEDEKQNLSVCRSQWIDDDLPEKFCPSRFKGENVGDNILVEWDSHNVSLSQYLAKQAATKEEYLSLVYPLLQELKERFATVRKMLKQLSCSEITESKFLSKTYRAREHINNIDLQIGRLPIAPFECIDMDDVLKSSVSFVSNIALIYSEDDLERRNTHQRLFLSRNQAKYAEEFLQKLAYEIDKVQ